MDKITVLLIDDNPGNDLGVRNFPEIKNDAKGAHYKDIVKHFRLIWLQSAVDIKEYLDLCYKIEDLYSSKVLGEQRVIPELVCFDYWLTPGENDNLPEEPIKTLIPTFKLGAFLDEKISRQYSGAYRVELETKLREECAAEVDAPYLNDPYKELLSEEDREDRINELLAEKLKLSSSNRTSPVIKMKKKDGTDYKDNKGCFGGGLVVLQFRNHPCVGIPTTSKDIQQIEGTDAELFEWYLQEQFDNNFDEKGRKVPKWTEMIPLGVKSLRKRMLELTRSNKIHYSLDELLQILNDHYEKGLTLTCWSNYGKRVYPLDGLFIDIEEEARELAIRDWIKDLLETMGIGGNATNQSIDIIKKAKSATDKLWDAYKDKTLFLKRVRLSKLYTKKKEEVLSRKEVQELDELEKIFPIIKNDKNEFIKNEIDIRSFGYSKVINNWIVVFMMVRLFSLHKKANKHRLNLKKADNRADFFLQEPVELDYLFSLFPIAKNPITLPIHSTSNSANRTWTKAIESKTIGLSISKIISDETKLENSVKYILRSYAIGLGLNQKDFPEWIKEEYII